MTRNRNHTEIAERNGCHHENRQWQEIGFRLCMLPQWRELSSEVSRSLESLKVADRFCIQTFYDTYGFPLDLTELMARERGLTVDVAGFNRLMEEQKARARAAQKKQVIELSQVETTTPTQFVGYDKLESPAKVLEVVGVKDKTAVILDSLAALRRDGRAGRRHRRDERRRRALDHRQHAEGRRRLAALPRG